MKLTKGKYFSTIPETLLSIIVKSENIQKRQDVAEKLLKIINSTQRDLFILRQKTSIDKLSEVIEDLENN